MLKETMDAPLKKSHEFVSILTHRRLGRNIHDRLRNNRRDFRSLSPRWVNNKSMMSFDKQTNRLDITDTCLSPHESRFEVPKLPQIQNNSKMKKFVLVKI